LEFGADTWYSGIVEENAGGQGLFSSKYIIFLNRVSEKAEAKEWLPKVMDLMKESENIFIVLEGKANTELKKAFEKYAEKVVVSDEKKDVTAGNRWSSGGEFNIFALADALGERNSLRSWITYRQAIDSGIEPENIIGTLFWQVKSMMLASQAKSATEAGLSPFVYSKSKRYATNFPENTLNTILKRLISIYHDGHRGLIDSELELERFLLRLSK
jgi:DNA polymerase III delta subunit